MEYQTIINLLETIQNQPSKFRIKKWVEINDESHGIYNTNGQIKFKTSMLNLSLCDYSAAYIAVKGTITVLSTGTATASHTRNKQVVLKYCAPFTDYISEISNTQLYNAKNNDVVMNVYNLIECS